MKKIFFFYPILVLFLNPLIGQEIPDSIVLRQKIEFQTRLKQLAVKDSLLKVKPQILVRIKKNSDVYFEDELVNIKQLNRRLIEKLENIVWEYDTAVMVISAEIGTPFSKVVKIMQIANKYKLRTILVTDK